MALLAKNTPDGFLFAQSLGEKDRALNWSKRTVFVWSNSAPDWVRCQFDGTSHFVLIHSEEQSPCKNIHKIQNDKIDGMASFQLAAAEPQNTPQNGAGDGFPG